MADLKGADEWLNRAQEHLAAFQEASAPLLDGEIETMIGSFDPDPNLDNLPDKVPSLGWRPAQAQIPLRLSVLIGEFIQAVRRSLDYLIYELAMLDSGRAQRGTQFPIDDRRDVFWARLAPRKGRSTSYLNGVDPKHATVIERYQPYRGVDWTKFLRSVSNPDKHRHLTIGNFSTLDRLGLPQHRIDQALTITRTKDGFTAIWNPDGRAQVQFYFSIFMAFEDKTPIYETLSRLKVEAGNVLEEFRPCFRGQCRHP